jgi:ElaB/YqjD/DUF883 family membrane-anchored ribosome-binding protein
MAEKPGDIEREIAERRRAISEKLDRVSARVGKDLRAARDEAGDRMPYGGNVDALVHDHPLASVAFAFGLGVLLGGVAPSASTTGRGIHQGAEATAGAGGGLLAVLLEPVRQPIQDEVTRLVRQAAAGFGENGRDGRRDGPAGG